VHEPPATAPKWRRLLSAVVNHPGSTRPELAALTGLKTGTVSAYVSMATSNWDCTAPLEIRHGVEVWPLVSQADIDAAPTFVALRATIPPTRGRRG
jgi:hypothetical protein